MKLITCKHCGELVRSTEECCPECGQSFKKTGKNKKMDKKNSRNAKMERAAFFNEVELATY